MARYSRRRYSGAPRPGRWMDLRYPGNCHGCDKPLAKGDRAFYDPRDRLICCTDIECADKFGLTREVWHGAPTSGRYVKTLSETRLLGLSAPARQRVIATTFSSGDTVYQNANGRCEDAPCCGCCT